MSSVEGSEEPELDIYNIEIILRSILSSSNNTHYTTMSHDFGFCFVTITV